MRIGMRGFVWQIHTLRTYIEGSICQILIILSSMIE